MEFGHCTRMGLANEGHRRGQIRRFKDRWTRAARALAPTERAGGAGGVEPTLGRCRARCEASVCPPFARCLTCCPRARAAAAAASLSITATVALCASASRSEDRWHHRRSARLSRMLRVVRRLRRVSVRAGRDAIESRLCNRNELLIYPHALTSQNTFTNINGARQSRPRRPPPSSYPSSPSCAAAAG